MRLNTCGGASDVVFIRFFNENLQKLRRFMDISWEADGERVDAANHAGFMHCVPHVVHGPVLKSGEV